MSDSNDKPRTSIPPKALTWTWVVSLLGVLTAAVVLGITQVMGEDNTARIIVGVLVLLGAELRKGRGLPPPTASTIVGVLAATEMAGTLVAGSL